MLVNIFVLLLCKQLLDLTAAKEYCQFESFNISCSLNQVIVMEDARYGRLKLGRCVNRDYGFIGCSANVLDLLDRSCSGQRSCQFHIPTLRDLVQPCPRDLTSYLEASYRCVPVLSHNPLRCNSTFLLSDTSSITHLVNTLPTSEPPQQHPNHPQQQQQGEPPPSGGSNVSTPAPTPTPAFLSAACPAVFRTRPGQRIQITLYTFGQFADYDPTSTGPAMVGESPVVDPSKAPCSYGISVVAVDEKGRRDSLVGGEGGVASVFSVCQVRQRVQHLITTNGTSAALHFYGDPEGRMSGGSNNRRVSYILKLEAIGCPDVRSPPHAWIERFEDRLVVRCNHSHETWYLTCKGTTWIGSITNCTEAAVSVNGLMATNRRRTIPFGLVIAIVVGIILGIVFGVLMLLSVFFYRHRDRYSEAVKNGFCPRRRDHHLATTTLMTTTTATTNRDDNDPGRHHHHHHHLFNRPSTCQPLSSPPPIYVRGGGGGTLPGHPSNHLSQAYHQQHQHHQTKKNDYMSPILEMHCYPTSPLPPPPPVGAVCRKCRLPCSIGGLSLLRGELSPSVDVGSLCPGCRTGGSAANPASSADENFSPRDVIGKGDGGASGAILGPRSITSNNINNIFCTINSQDSLALVSRPHHIPLIPHSSLPRPNLQSSSCSRQKASGSTSPERCPDLVQNGNDVASVVQTNHVVGSSSVHTKD